MKTILSVAPKWLFRSAALWALLAGFIIFFYSGAASVSASSESGGVQIVRHLNWYESQGWWGIAILFIFAALFYGPLRFYNRGQRGLATLFGLVTIILTVLAGFSVGAFYLPGATALLLGLLLLPFQARPPK